MNRFLEQLLGAAMSGRCAQMPGETVEEVKKNPEILLQTTPQGNTCLHIFSIFGHNNFLEEILVLTFEDEESPIKTLVCKSLLSSVNSYEETPLIVAVKNGHVNLAANFLRLYQVNNITEIILNSDINGDNALHHDIRYGNRNLALSLITAKSNLSKEVNKYHESPMYIAVMRGFDDVFQSLWEVPLSSDLGAANDNALHAAVRNRNIGIIERIMDNRPELAKKENILGHTPIQYVV